MYRGSLGVQIGNKHTLKDWGLGWTKITLGFPEAKTYEQDIPGMDGVLDTKSEPLLLNLKPLNRTITIGVLEFQR